MVPEEGSDADHEVQSQIVDLRTIFRNEFQIIIDCSYPAQVHAPDDPAGDNAFFVKVEVVSGLVVEQPVEGLELGRVDKVLRCCGGLHLHLAFSVSPCAISSGLNTPSTCPVSMAARGIEENSAVDGSWTKTLPPAVLIACTPLAPSVPAPEKITPITLSPASSARDEKNSSIGRCTCSSGWSEVWNVPLLMLTSIPGGQRYILPGRTSSPSETSIISRSGLDLLSSSARRLLCFVERCCMKTTEKPKSFGRAEMKHWRG